MLAALSWRTAGSLALALLVSFPAARAVAQDQDAPAAADVAPAEAVDQAVDDEAVHDRLRALRDRAVQAVNDAALDDLLELLDEDVVFTTMNAEVCRGKDEVRAFYDRMMVGPDRVVESLTVVELTVDTLSILHGNDTAIAYGSTHERYRLVNGLELDVHPRWSATLVREGDRWLLASFHSSVNLFDNPLLRITRRSRVWFAVVAAAAGLLVGLLIGRRRRRPA